MAGTAERHGCSAALVRCVTVGRHCGNASIQAVTVKQLQLKPFHALNAGPRNVSAPICLVWPKRCFGPANPWVTIYRGS